MPRPAAATEVFETVARRSILATAAALAALVAPAVPDASAATAPAAAPVLTSAPYTLPVTFHWTPGDDPLNTSQSVYRDEGVCTSPVSEGGPIRTFPGNATTDFSGNPVDGVYCYYIKSADLLTTANSPGLTVVVDTQAPTATVAVAGQVGGIVGGTVGVSGTSADAVSGVAASVFHAGAVGACPSGPVIGASWDTTATPNGAYEVCNVVTDVAGHVAVATARVTVSNLLPLAAAPAPAAAAPVAPAAPAAKDTVAPDAPGRLRVVLPRARPGAARVRVTLRWTAPVAPDLERVDVVLNARRAPRDARDGTRVYRGLKRSAVLSLRPGRKAYVALFAYDHAGNVSPPARRLVSLASLIPLRPLTGSVVDAEPHLTWKARAGSAYYNVQLFRNGRRVLVAWPERPAYTVPAGKLEPGTYVWFVWPALSRGGKTPAFAKLIGRATFVVKA